MAETLISPGVLARENDQSQVTSQPVQAGACIVGPTVLGRVGIPKLVTSYSEYLANFGSTFQSGSDEYTYFTSISAYNYFNNGGTSLIVDRVASGSWVPANTTLDPIRNNEEGSELQLGINMTGSLVGGGTSATLGGTVTGVTATGDANGGTFTFTIGQELGRLVTENIFAEITTNPVNAGAATYSDVATTSNGNGTGLKLDVVVAGTTTPTITSATVDASNKGAGYAANDVVTIAAGALGTGQLINADNVLPISGGAGKTAMGAQAGPFTVTPSSAVTGGTQQTGTGASFTLTNGGGSGTLTVAVVASIGTNYVTGNIITITQAELIAAGFTATVGPITLTLTSNEVQDSTAATFTLVTSNIQFEPTSLIAVAQGSGYAATDTLTFTAGTSNYPGNGSDNAVLTLQNQDIQDAECFTLETLTDGAVMNSGTATGTNGTLSNGTEKNVRWEIQATDTATGTFSLIIRQGDDTATAKRVLEIFPNISLDPRQSNYIERVVGNMTKTLNGAGTSDPYISTVGSYANASRYVRVKEVQYKTPNYFDNNGSPKAAFANYLPDVSSGSFASGTGTNVATTGMATYPAGGAKYYGDIVDANIQGFLSTDDMTAYSDAFNVLANKDDFSYNIITAPGLYYASSIAATPLNTLIQNTQTRGDAIAIVDLVNYISGTVATAKTQAASIDNSYAAAYWPWVQIVEPDSRQLVWVVPSAMIPGVYAYNDRTSEAWFAPAGINRGGLSTVVQAQRKLTQTNRDDLYTGKVNPIATFPGKGVVVFGQKTLQSQASALDRINVRRLLIALKSYIVQIADNLVFEQNTAATRNNFLSQVNPYLESVQQRQGLYAFKVVMDASNNGPDVVDRNQMVGAIYIQPTKTAEFIYLDFNILPTGASFPS
jgi:hypothetical protein